MLSRSVENLLLLYDPKNNGLVSVIVRSVYYTFNIIVVKIIPPARVREQSISNVML